MGSVAPTMIKCQSDICSAWFTPDNGITARFRIGGVDKHLCDPCSVKEEQLLRNWLDERGKKVRTVTRKDIRALVLLTDPVDYEGDVARVEKIAEAIAGSIFADRVSEQHPKEEEV